MEPSDPNSRTDPYDLSFFKVLIVEDSQFIRSIIASALKAMGINQVFAVHNIAEAKQKLLQYNAAKSSHNIDVVITDWLMPEGDGSELLSWIRSHKIDVIQFLPVIVCSAYTSEDLVNKARNYGATEILVKPVSAQKLANRILYVIDKPRPFIQAPGFFGPDRRRKNEKYIGEERRKTSASDIEEDHEQLE